MSKYNIPDSSTLTLACSPIIFIPYEHPHFTWGDLPQQAVVAADYIRTPCRPQPQGVPWSGDRSAALSVTGEVTNIMLPYQQARQYGCADPDAEETELWRVRWTYTTLDSCACVLDTTTFHAGAEFSMTCPVCGSVDLSIDSNSFVDRFLISHEQTIVFH